jgi:hypothetical protein
MLQICKCDRTNADIGVFATRTFCQKCSHWLDIWPPEAGYVSITLSSDKELLSRMGRSQKGLINRVDKSKPTPTQTQLNVTYKSYVLAYVYSEVFH